MVPEKGALRLHLIQDRLGRTPPGPAPPEDPGPALRPLGDCRRPRRRRTGPAPDPIFPWRYPIVFLHPRSLPMCLHPNHGIAVLSSVPAARLDTLAIFAAESIIAWKLPSLLSPKVLPIRVCLIHPILAFLQPAFVIIFQRGIVIGLSRVQRFLGVGQIQFRLGQTPPAKSLRLSSDFCALIRSICAEITCCG